MFPAPENREFGASSGAAGRSLVYVVGHGFTGSADRPEVEHIARFLRDRGATVVVPSFRGHGSSGGRSTVGVREVDDVAACVAWVRRQHPDSLLVTIGFSMGASIVVRHAALASSGSAAPDAIVAVSGPGRWYERGTRKMRLVHLGIETRLGRLVLRHGFRTRVDRDGWADLPESPVEVAGRITAPMLVVHGHEDSYFGVEHARMLAAAAPNAEMWLESGMGHAESGMTEALLARIDVWCRRVTGASATMSA